MDGDAGEATFHRDGLPVLRDRDLILPEHDGMDLIRTPEGKGCECTAHGGDEVKADVPRVEDDVIRIRLRVLLIPGRGPRREEPVLRSRIRIAPRDAAGTVPRTLQRERSHAVLREVVFRGNEAKHRIRQLHRAEARHQQMADRPDGRVDVIDGLLFCGTNGQNRPQGERTKQSLHLHFPSGFACISNSNTPPRRMSA